MNERTKLRYCAFILTVVYVGLLTLGFGAFYQVNTDPVPLSQANIKPVQFEWSLAGPPQRIPQRIGFLEQKKAEDLRPPAKGSKTFVGATGVARKVGDKLYDNRPSWYKVAGFYLHISSAFLDTRHGDRQVRILAIQHHRIDVTMRCSFQEDTNSESGIGYTSIASPIQIHPSWPPDKFYIAVMYSCQAPAGPVWSVGIDVKKSRDDDYLKFGRLIIPLTTAEVPTSGQGEKTAICIKAASGNLGVQATIEFLEFYRLLGIQDFVIYNSSITGGANRVLEIYSDMDIVKVVQFPLQEILYKMAKNQHKMNKADDYSIVQQMYLLSMNDCLYRFMDKYRFIVLVDLDEIITPVVDETLPFLLQKVVKRFPPSAAYTFRSSWYFEDFNKAFDPSSVDRSLTLINRLYRTPVLYSQPKSVILTNNTLCLNWHGATEPHPARKWLHDNVKLPRDGELGVYLHHFRPNCIDKFYQARCDGMQKTLTKDEILPRYMRRLKKRVMAVKNVINSV